MSAYGGSSLGLRRRRRRRRRTGTTVPAGGSDAAEPRLPRTRHRLPRQPCNPRGVRPPLGGAAAAVPQGCSVPHGRYGPCRAGASGGCRCPPARSPQPPGQRRGAPGALRRCAAAMAARLVRLLRLRKERTEGKGGGLQGAGGRGKRRGLSGSRLAFSRAFCPASRAARVAPRSHALLPAGPQQEARELGARGALRQAPLHQALRERLRSLQGLRASRGLRLVQVRALPWGAASSRPAPRLPCARPPPRISRAPAVPQGRSAVRVGTAARAAAGTSTGRFPVK